jgi:glucoamylase
VGTALGSSSRLWFTLSHGIVNEVYYHRVDQACLRDMGLIVTDGKDFFSEEKRHARSELSTLGDGIPAFRLINTCAKGRYRIEKEVLSDPKRDVLLQHVRFVPLDGGSYKLHVLLAPHLGNRGSGNNAWVGEYKGVPLLFAERHGRALALACSVPWLKRSAGFVGVSDLWQDLCRHRSMQWAYERAMDGNVALGAELDYAAAKDGLVLALGFGRNTAEAAHRAVASLWDGFPAARDLYVQAWRDWQGQLVRVNEQGPGDCKLIRTGAAVLRTHEAKRFPGGFMASLSVPWGFAKGDDDLGGYHLVWPRDLVESAGGLLAIGSGESARRVLRYLQVTQGGDGHWPQNMWVDGEPYWNGVQMDETALPILLVDLARREQALDNSDLAKLWPMVRRAAGFLIRNGPMTRQDRWEMDHGFSPFTLAAEISGLLAAAELADRASEPALGSFLRETADAWNDSVERWIYRMGTPFAKEAGIAGYYVRISSPEEDLAASPAQGFVPIKTSSGGGMQPGPRELLLSPDVLALVRFGLRAADDPRILDTIKAIDAGLRVETPAGPVWRRYATDRYGEYDNGRPYDGDGVGRAWPLLTGERAHYELLAGRRQEAERLLGTLEACANAGGLLPEQVWDGPDHPERELFFGRPTGSAMPLCWTHAEHLKLCRSLRDGRVFDQPPQATQRYVQGKKESPHALWLFHQKIANLPMGKTLRLMVMAEARVRFSTDGWRTPRDLATKDTGIGVHYVDLPTSDLPRGSLVEFTFLWTHTSTWEGRNFAVSVRA